MSARCWERRRLNKRLRVLTRHMKTPGAWAVFWTRDGYPVIAFSEVD